MPITVTCLGCKKQYNIPPARKETSKYCSRECLFRFRYIDNPNIKKKIAISIKNKKRDPEKEKIRIQKMIATKKKKGISSWNKGTATVKKCINCGNDYKAIGKRKYTGLYCSSNCRSEFSYINKDREKLMYYKKVWKITERQSLHLLPNYEKRGKLSRSEDAYHLDHIIPIIEGYRSNIAPEVIGNISNLRFIPAMQNIKRYYEN